MKNNRTSWHKSSQLCYRNLETGNVIMGSIIKDLSFVLKRKSKELLVPEEKNQKNLKVKKQSIFGLEASTLNFNYFPVWSWAGIYVLQVDVIFS